MHTNNGKIFYLSCLHVRVANVLIVLIYRHSNSYQNFRLFFTASRFNS